MNRPRPFEEHCAMPVRFALLDSLAIKMLSVGLYINIAICMAFMHGEMEHFIMYKLDKLCKSGLNGRVSG
jgi:hypothetical protein